MEHEHSTPLEIPPERIVESIYDIPLKENEFVFDLGHTYLVAEVGLVNTENLWQAQEDKGKNRAVINLANVNLDNTIQMDRVVTMIGEELRQSYLASNKEILDFFQEQVNNPEIPEDKKTRAREYLAKNSATYDKKIAQLRTKLQSANSFMGRISDRKEQSQYANFNLTFQTIQERFDELPQT